MKEEKISSRFAKVFAVASLITDRGERGCTIYEIMDMLGVNNRSSAFNVLETLDEMGFAYYTEKSSDGSRKMLYKIEPDMAAKWKNSIVSGVLSEDDIRFLNFVLETVSSTSPLMEMCGSDFISRLRMVINPNTKSEINPLQPQSERLNMISTRLRSLCRTAQSTLMFSTTMDRGSCWHYQESRN